MHAGEREQQRQRDRDRGQQRRPHAPEKQEENGDDDDQTFYERARHRMKRVVDELGAVVDRTDFHSGRQH